MAPPGPTVSTELASMRARVEGDRAIKLEWDDYPEYVINSATGEEIFHETLTGTSTIRVGNDLIAGQRQAISTIATKLAEQAVLHIVDGDWPEPAGATEAQPEAP